MREVRSRAIVAVVVGLGLAVTGGAASATAASGGLHVVKTITTKVEQPLEFAVSGKHVFVADTARATLTLVGRAKPLARVTSEGGDLAGVAVAGASIAYTSSSGDRSVTKLEVLRHGKKVLSADLAAFERKRNPDAHVRYGLQKPASATCKRQIEASFPGPASSRGAIGSHPVAVAALPNGAWAVADQDANDVLRVDRHGHVSVLGVLKGWSAHITSSYAKTIDAPACVGNDYRFESRPTDVERARGQLWVTSQPGRVDLPVSAAFVRANPQGSLYRIEHSGAVHLVATGIHGAMGVAVGTHGRTYVSELFTGRIAVVRHGRLHRVATLQNVVGLEWANRHLYASVMGPAATSPTNAAARIVQLG